METQIQNLRQRVMLIDDNKPLREVMAIMLRDEGYEVTEADDGKSALQQLVSCDEDKVPTCIVLDVMMPVMNGHEFLNQIEAQNSQSLKNIPVVVYSTEQLEQPHPQIKARLQKPVSVELLFSAIRGCADQ